MINDDFEGRETCLSAAFSSLQERQASFREGVASAHKHAVSQNTSWEKPARKEKEDATPVLSGQPAPNDGSVAEGNDDVSGTTADGSANGAPNNAILLDTIHAALQQIEDAIHLTERAVGKNDMNSIRLGTTRIADASLRVSSLSLLLDAKGKENLYMLGASLRHAAENLRALAKKGTAARSEMRDSISEMKIKFSSLSTGIGFVR